MKRGVAEFCNILQLDNYGFGFSGFPKVIQEIQLSPYNAKSVRICSYQIAGLFVQIYLLEFMQVCN